MLIFSWLLLGTIAVSTQDFVETEIVWSSDGGVVQMFVADCGDVLFTSYSKDFKDSYLHRFNPESKQLEVVDLSIEGEKFALTSINQNPKTKEIVLGYYGGGSCCRTIVVRLGHCHLLKHQNQTI